MDPKKRMRAESNPSLVAGIDADQRTGYLRPMRTFLLAVATLLLTDLLAQGFTSSYGGLRYEEAVGVLADGTAITAVASGYVEGGSGHHIRLLRTSLTGNGPVFIDVPTDGAVFPQAAVADDGAIIVCGSIIPPGRSDHDALLVALSIGGDMLWQWTDGDPATETQFLGLDRQDNGDFVVCGMRRQGADSDGLLTRISASGTLIWSHHYGTFQDEKFHAVAHDADGLVAAGRTSSDSTNADFLLVRTDASGAQTWTSTWGGTEDDEGEALIHRTDGSFVMAGHSASYPVADTTYLGDRSTHAYLMAFQPNSDTLWTRAYGDTLKDRQAFAVSQLGNGDLLIGGDVGRDRRTDALCIRATFDGAPLWTRAYGLERTDRIRAFINMPDGGFVAAGGSFGHLGGQVLLMRKNSNGQ